MSSYVFLMRSRNDRALSPEQEAAWHDWFQSFGESITAFHRVGETRTLGAEAASTVPSSFVVVTAQSLEAAEQLASGCPGLAQGGSVEIGEVPRS
jgi:aspartokinase